MSSFKNDSAKRLGGLAGARENHPFDIAYRALFKIALSIAVIVLAYKISDLLLLLFLGFLLAVSLEPVVVKLKSFGIRRAYAIAMIAATMTGIVVLLGVVVIPDIFDQVSSLVRVFPELKMNLLSRIPEDSNLKTAVSQAIDSAKIPDPSVLMTSAASVLNILFQGVTEFFLVLIFSIYLLIDGKRAFKWISDFFTAPIRLKMQATARDATVVIYGYVMGQVITSVLGAIYVYAVLRVLHVPAALTLAVIAGVVDIVPVLGFFIAVIPAVALAFSVSTFAGVTVLGLYVVYHGFENYFLVPWVYGNSMKVSPLVVLLALLIAGSVGGILGAIAILPVVASYPIIERIWLVKYLGRQVVTKHAEVTDTFSFSEQVKMWDQNPTRRSRPSLSLSGHEMVELYGKKVLIVEDDDDIRAMLADILETEGYSSVLASNGKEGLDILSRQSDFGLILLDMVMPIMDGRTFLQTIKAMPEYAAIPVIFLSSAAGVSDISGAAGVLRKPSEIDAVLNIVDQHFREPGSLMGVPWKI